ncbi:MAG: phosphopentomutase [Gammaproteobacteria bacterium]|nr:phosphopentomutase [Gammaproteobacteria bacterium]
MNRAIILVADGLGIGSSPDADKFDDVGANTFLHIQQHMENINKPLVIPNLTQLGLVKACQQASQQSIDLPEHALFGSFGYMQEISSGKDTPSGHWEMAGVPVLFEWGYFTERRNSFPEDLVNRLVEKTGVSGILGNRHMPGTDALVWFGDEHCQTRKPICYTSVDSVFQVAAHEQHFGLERLYDFCEAAREILDEFNIGRVIARPFLGDSPEEYKRTGNRRDYSVLPPSDTVLVKLQQKGGSVTSIGKISDIYAHQGITHSIKANGIDALMDKTIEQVQQDSDNHIIFTNLVNFDQDFGHRRNIEGYADALEYFDTRLSELMSVMNDDDVLFITADHGCDPSWKGTEHTREFVPILAYQKNKKSVELGHRDTFADLGQTLADMFKLAPMNYGTSFLQQIKS